MRRASASANDHRMTLSPAAPRFSIKTVLVLAATIAVPIAYQWYSERVALEVQIWSQSVLVERPGGLEKLDVKWDGVPVKGLSRIDVAVVNTGWKPIRPIDIVSPIEITLDSGQVLEVRPDRVEPRNVEIRFIVDSSRRSVTLEAPLLNRGDVIRFTILANVTPPPGITPAARVTAMRALTVTDRRQASRPLWRKVPWSVYLVSVGTVGAFLAFSFFLYLSAYVRAARHRWAMRPGYAATTVEYRELISWILGPETLEQEEVRGALLGTVPNRPLTVEQANRLEAAVGKQIRDVRVRTHWISAVLLLFFAVGLLYVALSVARAAGRGVG